MNAEINGANDIPELQAIVFASHVLKTFKDNDARVRVLRGVCKYFGLTVDVVAPGASLGAEPALVPAFEQLGAAAESAERFPAPDSRELAMAVVSGWRG
jgi:hypothetical protein